MTAGCIRAAVGDRRALLVANTINKSHKYVSRVHGSCVQYSFDFIILQIVSVRGGSSQFRVRTASFAMARN